MPATFLVKDALTLKDWSERFDKLIDSGLFHVFDDEAIGVSRHPAVEAIGVSRHPAVRHDD